MKETTKKTLKLLATGAVLAMVAGCITLSVYPFYNQKDYPDNFKKYIYFGKTDTITDTSIRSLNIVGRAYGFLADCSYIIDMNTGSEFCLSVLIYVNEKDILNTGKYEYDTIGLPFMADLGKAVLEYENKRKKKHKPNLEEFKHMWYPVK